MTTPQPSNSDLCLACGLCCNGAMYRHVRVKPEEIASLKGYGLELSQLDGKHIFVQPCPGYREQKCSIYASRPETCRKYECKLLRAYDGGQVGYEQALQHVQTALRLHADLRARLGAEEGEQIWQMAREMAEAQDGLDSVEFRRKHPDLMLNLVALRVFMMKHFYLRPPTKSAEQPAGDKTAPGE
jgi:uncharacterized protein